MISVRFDYQFHGLHHLHAQTWISMLWFFDIVKSKPYNLFFTEWIHLLTWHTLVLLHYCVPDKSSCDHVDISGYSGTVSVTTTGRTCQRWDSQSPHSHFYGASDLPDTTLTEASNYCRSVGDVWPWCYTTDLDERYEFCKLPDIGCCENCQYHRLILDSKVHGANRGHIWGRQLPSGPHVGPMNFSVLDVCDNNV